MHIRRILGRVLSCALSALLVWNISYPGTFAYAEDRLTETPEMTVGQTQDVPPNQEDDGTTDAYVLETLPDELGTVANGTDVDSIEPETDTVAEGFTLSCDGDGFAMEIRGDETSGIDGDTSVVVSEIPDDSPLYAETVHDIIDFLDPESIYAVRVFDIALERDGVTIEPDAPVTVNAAVDDMDADEAYVTHLAEQGPETLATENVDGAIEFTTGSFSRYVFYQKVGEKGTLATDLDGYVSPLVVRRKAGTHDYGSIQAEPKMYENSINGLAPLRLTKLTSTGSSSELRLASDGTETHWHFEAVDAENRPGIYYVWADVDGQRKYMTIEPRRGGDLTLSDTAGPEQEISVLYDDNGSIRLDHGGFAPNLKRDNFDFVFQSSNYFGESERVMLMTPLTSEGYAYVESLDDISCERQVFGQQGSAGEADKVVVFAEYTKPSGERAWAMLTHDGSLMPVTMNGDRIWWFETPTMTETGITWSADNVWTIVEYVDQIDDDSGTPTGYYEIRSDDGSTFVAPTTGSTISPTTAGLILDGRANHRATSTISMWDESAGAYVSLGMDSDHAQSVGEINGDVIWHFATLDPIDDETDPENPNLHPLQTVSSPHVRLQLFDFEEAFQNQVMGTTVYTPNNAQTNLLSQRLDADGWPTATRTNTNLANLFTQQAFVSDASNLFMKQIFDSTGFYSYNSRENYAWLNPDTDSWEVYRELGTGTAEDLKYGNFLPFNSIQTVLPRVNYNTSVGDDEPRYGEPIYISADEINYNFSMRADIDFYMAPDGIAPSGDHMRYEFTGDDDLWVYVDNQLVLDLGGIHSRLNGSIDFATGVVTAQAQPDTTLFDIFHAANVFPDGSPWDDTEVSEHFAMTYDPVTQTYSGTPTFADYTGHTLTMIYMERGKHSSNLKLDFNMPEASTDAFTVSKELPEDMREAYVGDRFPMRAIIESDGIHPDEVLGEATYTGTDTPVTFSTEVIGGITYDNVFWLRPGESVTFRGLPNDHYYVQELGIDSSRYDHANVNGNPWDDDEGEIGADGIVTSEPERIRYRPHTVIENIPSERSLRAIEIEKALAEGTVENPRDTFEFYAFVEATTDDGTTSLVPYAQGPYMLRDKDGMYCQGLEDGLPKPVSETPVTYERSGPYGTIANVPAGYTVIIPNIMAGTDFLVEERTSRLSEYELAGTEVTSDDTYQSGEASLTGQTVSIDGVPAVRDAMASVAQDHDSKVVVTNRATQHVIANKEWVEDLPITDHSPVMVALFRETDDGLEMVDGTERELSAPAWSCTWDVTDAHAYTVREVRTDGDTPLPVEGDTQLPIDVTIAGSATTALAYVADYAQEDTDEDVVTHTVTNTYSPAIAMPSTGKGGMDTMPLVTGLIVSMLAACEITRRRLLGIRSATGAPPPPNGLT